MCYNAHIRYLHTTLHRKLKFPASILAFLPDWDQLFSEQRHHIYGGFLRGQTEKGPAISSAARAYTLVVTSSECPSHSDTRGSGTPARYRCIARVLRQKSKLLDLLRKTRAMSLYQEGCPLSYIQQMLGHENISTTSGFYAFVTLDTLAKALERTNPEGRNAEKSWKDKKISEALYRL